MIFFLSGDQRGSALATLSFTRTLTSEPSCFAVSKSLPLSKTILRSGATGICPIVEVRTNVERRKEAMIVLRFMIMESVISVPGTYYCRDCRPRPQFDSGSACKPTIRFRRRYQADNL